MIQQVLKDNKIDLLSLQEHAIATLSCKASLKGNSHLSIESMQTIVDNLMRCDNPYVCPHGRPTIIHYSAYDLENYLRGSSNEKVIVVIGPTNCRKNKNGVALAKN